MDFLLFGGQYMKYPNGTDVTVAVTIVIVIFIIPTVAMYWATGILPGIFAYEIESLKLSIALPGKPFRVNICKNVLWVEVNNLTFH